MRVINDLHVSAKRQAGATPESQAALRTFIFEELHDLVLRCEDSHLTINGDLFDRFDVPLADLIDTYSIFSEYLNRGTHLTCIAGNHDWNHRGDKKSAFHTLVHFLSVAYPGKVDLIDYTTGFSQVSAGVWAIPHMPNTDLFNIEIEKALTASEVGVLLLHCNYENEFAQHSDASLNLDNEQTTRLLDAGWTLLAAHEHQHRLARDGRVIIVGNQIITSVSDALGSDTKFYATVGASGVVSLIEHRRVDSVFYKTNWRDLDSVPDTAKFIRVEGAVAAEDAAEVVNAISSLRKRHSAFVITNATEVEGMAQFDELSRTAFEDLGKFDVLGLLLEEFDEKEQAVLKELLQ